MTLCSKLPCVVKTFMNVWWQVPWLVGDNAIFEFYCPLYMVYLNVKSFSLKDCFLLALQVYVCREFVIMQKDIVFLFLLNLLFHPSTLPKIFKWPCSSQKTVCSHQNLLFFKTKDHMILFELADMLKTI